jgi:hypothetical protein
MEGDAERFALAASTRRYGMKRSLSVLVAGAVAGAGLVVIVSCGGNKAASDPTTEVGCVLLGPTVNPSVATLHPGDSLRAVAAYTPCSGSPVTDFQWRSTNTAVATVGANDGVVHAFAPGRVTIIVSVRSAPEIMGAMALSVE